MEAPPSEDGAKLAMTSFSLRGVPISFPFPPYQVQRLLMERVIETVQTGTNALLESPTGTGKTLSLLCSTRAWQNAQILLGQPRSMIIYASRTHAQLEQVARELKRTSYGGNALLIGSRETSCSHPEVSRMKGRDQIVACRELVDTKACAQRERTHLEVRKKNDLVDIEDIVRPGMDHRFCPYYYSRDVLTSSASGGGKTVDILFMPYNYIVDPAVRRGLDIPWKDAVIVIDEAHNIEDVCEDACSFSLTRAQMLNAIHEVDGLLTKCTLTGGSLAKFNIESGELSKIKAIFKGLNDSFQRNYQASVTSSSKPASASRRRGSDLFNLLRDEGLSFENYRLLTSKLDACVDALSPQGKFVEMVVKCLTRAFELGGEELDFPQAQLAADEFYRLFFEKAEDGGWKLNFWCFSPGVAMRELVRKGVRSIIVASGTLSPLDSFASSLRIPFPIRLEGPHVVANDRVWLGVVPKGVTQKRLNSSFEHRESVDYQQELGRTITALARIIPDGVLVFFPSYAFMNTCLSTWKQCNVWESLLKIKEVVLVEERGNNGDQQDQNLVYEQALANGGGAMLFAVCRGKASEGMDFKDKRARGVIVVGLPFPNKNDAKVLHKKSYMDEVRAAHPEQNFLSGQAWYSQQAYRAVNQAVGRAIRHEFDFGAIVLLDERFENVRMQLSSWLRPFCQTYSKGLGDAISTLAPFFRHLKLTEPKSAEIVIAPPRPPPPPPVAVAVHPPPPAQTTVTSNGHIGGRLAAGGAESLSISLRQNFATRPHAAPSSSSAAAAKPVSSSGNLPLGRSATVPQAKKLESGLKRSVDPSSAAPLASREDLLPSKKQRSAPVSFEQSTLFMAECRKQLSTDGYSKFTQLIRDFHARDKTKPARDLNVKIFQLFAQVRDSTKRFELLTGFAQFLPPVLGRSLIADMQNR